MLKLKVFHSENPHLIEAQFEKWMEENLIKEPTIEWKITPQNVSVAGTSSLRGSVFHTLIIQYWI